jgi:pilus assembly protein Flp/PilA
MLGLYLRIMNRINELKNREEGQGLVEYALIIVLVSIIAIVALNALGDEVSEVFDSIQQTLSNRP